MKVKLVCAIVLLARLCIQVAGQAPTTDSDSVVVRSDIELFNALCAQKTLIWLGSDISLREEHWPANCTSPVRYQQNLTISGNLTSDLLYTLEFNFVARKVVIPVNGEVRLRHFIARNTRRGGGGEIDFIAYSPDGILWTDDLNKNQIICTHADPSKLAILPLPAHFPQFANSTQMVENWDSYCCNTTRGQKCWQEVLHYQQFYTDVNVGSDTETGGYVMAKANSSKTCDAFVTDNCTATLGPDKCLAAVINAYLANLPPLHPRPDDGGGVDPLVIALPVALGGAALIAAVVFLVWFTRRRRQRRRTADAEAAAAAAKLGGGGGEDVESAGGAAGGGRGGQGGGRRGGGGRAVEHGSKCLESNSGSGSGSKEEGGSVDELPYGNSAAHHHHHHDGDNSESFRYETNDDMGRCLSANGRSPPSAMSPGSAGSAVVEGVMDDGSVCTISVGAPLGQGSYGIVFKGVWKERPVAVKLILCDKHHSERVTTEVRLMMSEECRHPNLLGAFACMTKARLVNKQAPATQALQSTIASLSSSARNRSGAALPGSGRSGIADQTEMAETWIVSEYCDLGALAPLVHIAKRFLVPATTEQPRDNPGASGGASGAATTTTTTTTTTTAAVIPSAASSGAPSSSAAAAAVPPAAGGGGGTAVLSSSYSQPPSGPRTPPLMSAEGPMSPLRPPSLPLAQLMPAARAAGGGGVGTGAGGAVAAAAAAGRRPHMAAILACLRDIAAGMAHLHSLNIVHGDLKLANVLLMSRSAAVAGAAAAAVAAPEEGGEGGAVGGASEAPSQACEVEGDGGGASGCQGPATPEGPASADASAQLSGSMMLMPGEVVAKVADFGLSRCLKEGQTHHSTKTVGTVTHMPPELLKSGKLTLSGDVYSFGIIMWEMLTGMVPYKGLMYGEVVERVVVSHRRPEFPPHTPLAYRTLAERCWAAEAAARPPFSSVLSELEALLADAATLQAESDSVALPPWQSSGGQYNYTNNNTGNPYVGDGGGAAATTTNSSGSSTTSSSANTSCANNAGTTTAVTSAAAAAAAEGPSETTAAAAVADLGDAGR